VHLDVTLVNDQLDALFSMHLFRASTCFEQQVLIIRRIKSCQYIIWYKRHSGGGLSCVQVGTQDSHPLDCIIPGDVLTRFDPPDDEHLLLETWRGVK
jgi:hypothetical protein